MKRCLITYNIISENAVYSKEGLKEISPHLDRLNVFPYTASEQRKEAKNLAGKMSIQGVQPKLSAVLNLKEAVFEITANDARYILKPQSAEWAELPENEDLTMKLASLTGIEVPFHGLILSSDGSHTYLIRRMDRFGHKDKIPLEDFAQLAGLTRETKYDSSMEQAASLIEKFCTFPLVEKEKLFVRTLFNYLIGNEDMHLKNFSLITREGITRLSPAYDLINSTLVLRQPKEEIALPLRGKKRKLTKGDFIDYFGKERLGLNQKIIDQILGRFVEATPRWKEWVEISFLSETLKEKYWKIVEQKRTVLQI